MIIVLLLPFFNKLYCMHCLHNVVIVIIVVEINVNSSQFKKIKFPLMVSFW